MALPAYGVLIGTLNHFTREGPNSSGSYSHGKLYADTPAGQYEAAVDVSTPSSIKVQYRLVRHLSRPALASALALPLGWSPLPSTRFSGAIDYVRSSIIGVGMAALGLRKRARSLQVVTDDQTPDEATEESAR